MSESDTQHAAKHIDIVLDILVAGDYHSAIHNFEIFKAELLRQVTESTSDIPKAPWEIWQSCFQTFLFGDAQCVSIFLFSIITL